MVLRVLHQSPRHLAMLLAALVFALAFWHGPVSGPLVDSGHFAGIAKTLAETGQYAVNGVPSGFYPVYPTFLAAAMVLVGPLWQNMAVALASVLLFVSAWLFFAKALDEKKAVLAAVVLAVTPLFVNAGLQLLTDGLFLAFAMLSGWAYLWALEKPDWRQTGILAVFLSLCVLTRISGLLLIGIFVAHMAWRAWAGKTHIHWKPIALVLVFAAVVFGAWALRNQAAGIGDATGGYADTLSSPIAAFVTLDSTGGRTTASFEEFRTVNGVREDLNGALVMAVPFNLGLDASWQWPLAFNYMARTAAFLVLLAGIVMVAVSLGGAAKWLAAKNAQSRFKRMDAGAALLVLWFLGFAAFHILSPAALPSRYLLPLVVPLAAGFAVFVSDVGRKKAVALLLGHLLVCGAVLAWDSGNRWQSDADAAAVFSQAGQWIDAHAPTDAMVRVSGVPPDTAYFYSGRMAREDAGSVFMASNYGQETPPQGLSA
ncbi:MAG: glycosyltransferase family 39 protein, partial [Candidatus Micrarchaeota archaeon]|nr:glycosyltransferase family 39 protein [Candidatus Micrarchaeota archaeon]